MMSTKAELAEPAQGDRPTTPPPPAYQESSAVPTGNRINREALVESETITPGRVSVEPEPASVSVDDQVQ